MRYRPCDSFCTSLSSHYHRHYVNPTAQCAAWRRRTWCPPSRTAQKRAVAAQRLQPTPCQSSALHRRSFSTAPSPCHPPTLPSQLAFAFASASARIQRRSAQHHKCDTSRTCHSTQRLLPTPNLLRANCERGRLLTAAAECGDCSRRAAPDSNCKFSHKLLLLLLLCRTGSHEKLKFVCTLPGARRFVLSGGEDRQTAQVCSEASTHCKCATQCLCHLALSQRPARAL